MLKYEIALTAVIIGGIALIAGTLFLFHKIKWNSELAISCAFALGVGTALLYFWQLNEVHVIHSRGTYDSYVMILSSTKYKTTDNRIVNIKTRNWESCIINESDQMLDVEKVSYSESAVMSMFSEAEVVQILPHKSKYLPYQEIDYFFKDEPPNSISVTNGMTSYTKYWLHFTRSE